MCEIRIRFCFFLGGRSLCHRGFMYQITWLPSTFFCQMKVFVCVSFHISRLTRSTKYVISLIQKRTEDFHWRRLECEGEVVF